MWGCLLLLVGYAASQARGVDVVGQAITPHPRSEGHQATPQSGGERRRPLLHHVGVFVLIGVTTQARDEAFYVPLAACKQQHQVIAFLASLPNSVLFSIKRLSSYK